MYWKKFPLWEWQLPNISSRPSLHVTRTSKPAVSFKARLHELLTIFNIKMQNYPHATLLGRIWKRNWIPDMEGISRGGGNWFHKKTGVPNKREGSGYKHKRVGVTNISYAASVFVIMLVEHHWAKYACVFSVWVHCTAFFLISSWCNTLWDIRLILFITDLISTFMH